MWKIFTLSSHHDLPGQHAIFADHPTVSSTTANLSPYAGNFRPVYPASLNSRNVPESSNSNRSYWNGPSIPAEMPTSYIPISPIMRQLSPLLVGHSSGTRTDSLGASSMIPPYPGSSARARDRVQALQTYYQPSDSPAIHTPRQTGHRNMTQVAPLSASMGSIHQPAGGSDTGTTHRHSRYYPGHGSVRPPSQDRS